VTATADPAASSAGATQGTLAVCHSVMQHHARTFSLAAALLPSSIRDDAAVTYAFCRHADDIVDGIEDRAVAAARLQRLRDALEDSVGQRHTGDPMVAAFAEVMRRCAIPLRVPQELLAGMEMDLRQSRYPTLDGLLLYCYRAAGTVGLMMARVMGVSGGPALTRAVHLGIAMQLTNICRDVLEDWGRSRLYLPSELLARAGCSGLEEHLGDPFPAAAVPGVAEVVRLLLAMADRYYASADEGLLALPWHCSVAVRTAREIYAAIGEELARRGHDIRLGRVAVSPPRKGWLLVWSVLRSLGELPSRVARAAPSHPERGGVDAHDFIRL
jgi:15-cis-phytoene synthase